MTSRDVIGTSARRRGAGRQRRADAQATRPRPLGRCGIHDVSTAGMRRARRRSLHPDRLPAKTRMAGNRAVCMSAVCRQVFGLADLKRRSSVQCERPRAARDERRLRASPRPSLPRPRPSANDGFVSADRCGAAPDSHRLPSSVSGGRQKHRRTQDIVVTGDGQSHMLECCDERRRLRAAPRRAHNCAQSSPLARRMLEWHGASG